MISAIIPKWTRTVDVGTDGVSLSIPGKPHERRHASVRLLSGIGVQGKRATLNEDPAGAVYGPTEYLCTITTASTAFETIINGVTLTVNMDGTEGTNAANKMAANLSGQAVGSDTCLARPLPGDATGTKIIVGLASGDKIASMATGTGGPGAYVDEVYSSGCEFDLASHDETVEIALEEFDCLALCTELGISKVRVTVGSHARIHHQE